MRPRRSAAVTSVPLQDFGHPKRGALKHRVKTCLQGGSAVNHRSPPGDWWASSSPCEQQVPLSGHRHPRAGQPSVHSRCAPVLGARARRRGPGACPRACPGREGSARRAGRATTGSAHSLETVLPGEHVRLRGADASSACRWAVSPGTGLQCTLGLQVLAPGAPPEAL